MKSKYLILFAVVLIVLIVLYAVQQRNARITVVETGVVQVLPGLDTGAISEIHVYVTGEDPKLVLKKEGDAWAILSNLNERADKGKIETLLKDFRELKGEVRASKDELYGMFGVQEEKALVLDLLDKDGQNVITLFAGKRGPSGSGGFLRIKGRPEVYLADKNIPGTFGLFGDERKTPEPKPWADLKLLPSSKNQWARVELHHPEITAAFVKERLESEVRDDDPDAEAGKNEPASTIWVQKKPKKPDLGDSVVQGVLDALARLRANQVMDSTKTESYGLAKPDYRIRIVSDDKSEIQLLANRPKKDGPIYVKLDNSDLVFEISEAGLNTVFDPIKKRLSEKTAPKTK